MIYTKTGDEGYSKNIKNISYSKDYILFELLGTVDELSSTLGVAKNETTSLVKETITAFQKELISLCAYIADGDKFDTKPSVMRMEELIDAFSKKITKKDVLCISGDTKAGAFLDVSRTVARRAERVAVKASKLFVFKKEDLPYFNRLSDLLYILARYEDQIVAKPQIVATQTFEISGNTLDLKRADALCDAVMQKAREIGVSVVCCACDSGGNTITLKRDNNAYIASIKIAENKAYTAVSLKMPTYKLETLTKPGDSLYGIQHQDSRIIIFGGGVPLYGNDNIIGGFGVSGGTLEQDTMLGDYADKIFN